MDLRDVGQLAKDLRISQGDIDDSVMCEGREGVKRGDLLASAEAGSRHEDTGVFAGEGARRPEAASRVPERLR